MNSGTESKAASASSSEILGLGNGPAFESVDIVGVMDEVAGKSVAKSRRVDHKIQNSRCRLDNEPAAVCLRLFLPTYNDVTSTVRADR